MGKNQAIFRKVICLPIRLYQYLRPALPMPASCRFYPSCSQYANEALSQYGLFKGTHLSIRRLLRCHPWSSGGYDPIIFEREKQ